MLKPLLEMLCLCAGAAAGIFLMNFLSDRMNNNEESQEHKCNCNHDVDGDCCGGCGHCGEGHECCGHCHNEDDAE